MPRWPIAKSELPKTGAPANLKRLETHEADAEEQVNAIKERLAAVRELLTPNGDDESQRALKMQVSLLQGELVAAYDLWFKLSKQVRDFDKSVKEDRRTGATVPQAEAKEFFEQLLLSVDLAVESYIISLSQEACRCETPEQFHIAHATNLRSCKLTAIEAAKREGSLPAWLL